MCVSTLFNDPKIGQTMAQFVQMVPLVLILQVLQVDSTAKWLVYPLFLFPISPCVLQLMKLSQNTDPAYASVQVFDLNYVNSSACWAFVVAAVPIWFCLFLYLDAVMPSEYGINLHPCFCLQKRSETYEADDDADLENLPNTHFYNSRDPIRLQKLTKKFGSLTAVDALQLSIRENEVYTILGHNGAGKTTTIFMLTGVLKPSGGNATVYGHQIKSQIDLVQQNLGLCQQFDVLFDQLTIKQHLQLTCAIKCMPED
jgi:ABC-type siderophore export system fused ATPase/permease subunit